MQTFKVSGSFDDCQALVKQAFADQELRQQLPLSSANLISIGRLLPQMSYYAAAALRWRELYQAPANFVIPSGNLGNSLACVLARKLGLPIGEIVLSTNANRVLPEFLHSGEYQPRASLQTLANAMDVGAPSNLERLRALFPQHADLVQQVSADSVDDGELRRVMANAESRYGHIVCPHTAAALAVIQRRQQNGDPRSYIAVATAHPAKFDTVVEPCIGHPVAVPPALEELLRRPARAEPLAADYQALRQHLLSGLGTD